jgi:hypothetical protein
MQRIKTQTELIRRSPSEGLSSEDAKFLASKIGESLYSDGNPMAIMMIRNKYSPSPRPKKLTAGNFFAITSIRYVIKMIKVTIVTPKAIPLTNFAPPVFTSLVGEPGTTRNNSTPFIAIGTPRVLDGSRI